MEYPVDILPVTVRFGWLPVINEQLTSDVSVVIVVVCSREHCGTVLQIAPGFSSAHSEAVFISFLLCLLHAPAPVAGCRLSPHTFRRIYSRKDSDTWGLF